MALGNLGAVRNLLDNFVATTYVGARSHQGVALFPELCARVATRADLTYTNLRVYGPDTFDGTNDVDIEAGAVGLIGVLIDNTEAAINALVIYNTATVTEGTTDPKLVITVPASSMLAVVFPEPVALAAFSYSAIDGDQTAGGTTLAAASSLISTFVYCE